MRWIGFIGAFALATGVGLILAGQLGMLQGTPPGDLGVNGGRLKPPSMTSNSVSSQAGLYPDHPQRLGAMVTAFAVRGSAAESLARIEIILRAMPGTQIIQSDGHYIYAQCSTPLLRFTDDVEFWWDASQGVIQVRSASRLGAGDLGTNRKRVEAIRAQF